MDEVNDVLFNVALQMGANIYSNEATASSHHSSDSFYTLRSNVLAGLQGSFINYTYNKSLGA